MDRNYILVYKMKNGDEGAMEVFVRKYYPHILKYLHYRTWSREVAEDLTQEVFIKFFQGLPKYKHRGKLLNYLYTIAGNAWKDYFKGKTPELPDYTGKMLERGNAPGSDPTGRWAERMDVKEAVGKLPEEFQEVIVFHYFLDMKQKDIARACGISLPLVKYRLKQAKDRLVELLEEREERNGL